ncbi:MAG TPA: hypothetical protein VF894_01240 [Anaeromyxobacter sp.]
MAETQKLSNGRSVKVPEFLKEPLEAAQHRLEQLEVEAQRVLRDLMDKGRASRKDFEQIVQKLSKQDWTFPEMKHRIEKLREQGVERAVEWRGRAETFRAEAMERVMDLQGRAIAFLGVASRDQVDELSRELDRLSKRIPKGGAPRRTKKGEA